MGQCRRDVDFNEAEAELAIITEYGSLHASSGLGGALRAPLGPVVAPLVPRCALLPAPTPRDVLSALGTRLIATPATLTHLNSWRHTIRQSANFEGGEAPSCGGWGREGGCAWITAEIYRMQKPY